MTQELSAAVQKRIGDHLDAVEKVLIDTGRTREQCRAVLDDLESQIVEMLAARTASPMPSDVEAVLDEIDPPNAYAEPKFVPDGNAQANAMSEPAPHTARTSKIALWGFCCVIASLVSVPLQAILYANMVSANRVSMNVKMNVNTASPNANMTGSGMAVASASWLLTMIAIVAGLVGTILGWIGFVKIRESHGNLCGTGRALFAGLFYPIVLLFCFILCFGWWV